MEIRRDFKDVEKLLRRLLMFASVFHRNNIEKWPHLKNKEDFDNVYELDSDLRGPLGKIYGDGRDLAVFMSQQLEAFNYPDVFPTLKKFIDSFDNGWLYELDLLRNDSQKAKDIHARVDHQFWSVGQMINLFDEQISLLEDVKKTLDGLKASDIYKFESGNVQSTVPVTESSMPWDVFISHAREDKEEFVRDLANKLTNIGLKVWYDEFTLILGDSLRRSIDHGLSNSRFGIVVLSKSFFLKEWPQRELDGLAAMEPTSGKIILPIWHHVTKKDVEAFSPTLADKFAVSSEKGIEIVANEVLAAIKKKSLDSEA